MPAIPTQLRTRRGSIYLHVLASSLLVDDPGPGLPDGGPHPDAFGPSGPRLRPGKEPAPLSAVELGLLQVRQDPNLEEHPAQRRLAPGQAAGRRPLHAARASIPATTCWSDSEYEPLVLTGTGTQGLARHKTQVTLVPVIKPLEALNTCIHGSGLIHVKSGKQITAVGAPLSTNGQLDNDGTLDGNAQAQSINDQGTITGTLTVPAPAKPMPAASVITTYATKATTIPYVATIDKAVLTPGCNPWGSTDPNGLYVLDTGGKDLIIKNTRIHGTLVIKAVGKTVTLDDAMFCRSYRSNFPVLLVEGNLTIKCTSADLTLSESANGKNYNPLGAPYEGAWDEDTTDTYPNEIRGLIHVKGTLSLQQIRANRRHDSLRGHGLWRGDEYRRSRSRPVCLPARRLHLRRGHDDLAEQLETGGRLRRGLRGRIFRQDRASPKMVHPGSTRRPY